MKPLKKPKIRRTCAVRFGTCWIKKTNVLMEEEFSFEKVITNQVNEYLNEIKIKHFGIPNDDVQLVGIHVRRGDYEDYVQQRKPHGGYFFSKFYFQNAMNYFRYIYRIIFYINRYDQ